jgi:hypothetical protein
MQGKMMMKWNTVTELVKETKEVYSTSLYGDGLERTDEHESQHEQRAER